MNTLEKLYNSEEYRRIREDSRIKNSLIFITYGGSHAYGTNIETSDIDIRGVFLEPVEHFIGNHQVEQIEDKTTDTVIYGFNKFVSLLTNCNPNVIEMLGTNNYMYGEFSDIAHLLINNSKLFLSKRAARSFGGYAIAQLRRLQNALSRVDDTKNKFNLRETLTHVMGGINDRYPSVPTDSINIRINQETNDTTKISGDNMDVSLYCDVNFNNIPLKEALGALSELSSIIKSYDKINHRNNKKDTAHLCKHAMHLIRLYMMGIDILEKEQIITRRDKEHDLLMNIRNGKYFNGEEFTSEFYDIVNNYEKRFDYACKNTSLPDKPDLKKIENFVMSCNMRRFI